MARSLVLLSICSIICLFFEFFEHRTFTKRAIAEKSSAVMLAKLAQLDIFLAKCLEIMGKNAGYVTHITPPLRYKIIGFNFILFPVI